MAAAYLSQPPSTCFPEVLSELPPEVSIKHVLPHLLAFVHSESLSPASLAYEIPAILQGPAGSRKVYYSDRITSFHHHFRFSQFFKGTFVKYLLCHLCMPAFPVTQSGGQGLRSFPRAWQVPDTYTVLNTRQTQF